MIKPSKHFWKVFKETPGALSTAEAIAIANVASQAPNGLCMELGTHKGKSAMSAILGLREGRTFFLVDPIFEDIDIERMVTTGVYDIVSGKMTVVALADISINVIPKHDRFAYVFLDTGSHGDGLPMQEVKLLEDKIISGGILAFHDYKNQFTEVEIAYNYLLSTGKYEEIKINWEEIFAYVKENNLEDGNNSWHLYPELPHPPNFVGALKRK